MAGSDIGQQSGVTGALNKAGIGIGSTASGLLNPLDGSAVHPESYPVVERMPCPPFGGQGI